MFVLCSVPDGSDTLNSAPRFGADPAAVGFDVPGICNHACHVSLNYRCRHRSKFPRPDRALADDRRAVHANPAARLLPLPRLDRFCICAPRIRMRLPKASIRQRKHFTHRHPPLMWKPRPAKQAYSLTLVLASRGLSKFVRKAVSHVPILSAHSQVPEPTGRLGRPL